MTLQHDGRNEVGFLCGDQGIVETARGLKRSHPDKHGWLIPVNGRLHKGQYMIRGHAEFVQYLMGKGLSNELGFRSPKQFRILLGEGYMANCTHKADPYSYGLYSYGLYSYGLYRHGLYSYGLHRYNTFSCWAVQQLLWLVWKTHEAFKAVPCFEAAQSFAGARKGTVFKTGEKGLGYYQDTIENYRDTTLTCEKEVPLFEDTLWFDGERPGAVFKTGEKGLGYYCDTNASVHGRSYCCTDDKASMLTAMRARSGTDLAREFDHQERLLAVCSAWYEAAPPAGNASLQGADGRALAGAQLVLEGAQPGPRWSRQVANNAALAGRIFQHLRLKGNIATENRMLIRDATNIQLILEV